MCGCLVLRLVGKFLKFILICRCFLFSVVVIRLVLMLGIFVCVLLISMCVGLLLWFLKFRLFW